MPPSSSAKKHVSKATPDDASTPSSSLTAIKFPAVERQYMPQQEVRQSVVRQPLDRSVHERHAAEYAQRQAAAPAAVAAAWPVHRPAPPAAPAPEVAARSSKAGRRVRVADIMSASEAAAPQASQPAAASARPLTAGTAGRVHEMATSMLPLHMHEKRLKLEPQRLTGMTATKREKTMALAIPARRFVEKMRAQRPGYDEAIGNSHKLEVASTTLGLAGSAVSLSGVGAPAGHALAMAAATAKFGAANEENEAGNALLARPKSPTGRGWALAQGHLLNSRRQGWQAAVGLTPLPLGGLVAGKAHDRVNKREKEDISLRFVNGVLQNMPPDALPDLQRKGGARRRG